MKITNKNLAVKMVLGAMLKLYTAKALPTKVIDGKVFMVAPRAFWGEHFKKYLTLKQIDRIFAHLEKEGVIKKVSKHHNNKKISTYILYHKKHRSIWENHAQN
jgi:hypothetical protein